MRHDHYVIKHVHKLYGPAMAKWLQSLPFFYISEELENGFANFQQLNEEGFKRQYSEYDVDLMDHEEVERILPFPMFAIMDHDIGWHTLDWRGDGIWHVGMCIDRMMRDMGINVPPGTLFGFDMRFLRDADSPDKYAMQVVAKLLVNMETGRLDGLPIDMQNRFVSMSQDPKFLQGMGSHLGRNILYFLSYFKWAEGMHMVEVRKQPNNEDIKQKAKGYKKPWLRGDLPHYIYLDSPSYGKGNGSTSGDPTYSMRGHHRRAHWRTLTHARFKNHPMYGKRIRVRAAWVGPTEWTVGNTVYTVRGERNVFNRGTDKTTWSDKSEGDARGHEDQSVRNSYNHFGKSFEKESG